MKSKKNLTIGIFIGICVIVLPLILMSNTSSVTNEKENKFELVSPVSGSNVVYMLNKQTGETWYIVNQKKIKHD